MSLFLSRPEQTEPPVPAVRTNPAKRELLKTKVTALLQPVSETKQAISDGAELDIFGMAVAIRAALPAGLEAGDFDGTDITEIVSEILASA